ncbi:MAG: Type-1 restriction enzyme EcoKI specificity protein [Bacteroidetes bacterium ADurb.BinA174]|nr:MAG: Type-1 restriction enzyme EcoKI specificity protein [Bacteroidetes bacterium ADurb.BinA174]
MKEKWEIKKLGEISEFINGFAFKSNLFLKVGFPIVRISNIKDEKVDLTDVVFFDKKDYVVDLSKYKVQQNDILIAMSGATTGKIGIYLKNDEIYLNQRVGAIRTFNSVNNHFVFYFLKTKVEETLRLAAGVAQPNIGSEQIKSYEIPIPPLPIQEAIVKELDILHRLKNLQEQQLVEYDNLAQSTFYSMFGDPIENEKGWEVRKLGEIANLKAGQFVQAKDILPFNKNLFPCFGGNGLRGFTHSYTHEGSFVLIGRQGALCGNVKIANGKFHATEHAVVCSPVTSYDTIWLFFTLDELNLNRLATGAAQPGLAVGNLEKVDLPFPPLSLQTSFAKRIEKIEAQKDLIKQAIAETQLLINYTMDKYFG